jgi:hypothetical protein
MTYQERQARTLRIARERHDLAAVAIIEGGRKFPEPERPVALSPWRDVRTVAA